MLILGGFAALMCAMFALLWWRKRLSGAFTAAVAWGLYAVYELLMRARILCSGDCNIRVDLLAIWPLLLVLSLMVAVRVFMNRKGRR